MVWYTETWNQRIFSTNRIMRTLASSWQISVSVRCCMAVTSRWTRSVALLATAVSPACGNRNHLYKMLCTIHMKTSTQNSNRKEWSTAGHKRQWEQKYIFNHVYYFRTVFLSSVAYSRSIAVFINFTLHNINTFRASHPPERLFCL
jgi:hypothetical protein